MESYFFIPGSKLQKIAVIKDAGADNIIIDMEDSLAFSERGGLLQELIVSPVSYSQHWVRVPLRSHFGEAINTTVLDTLINAGYRNFVLPKILDYPEWLSFARTYENSEIACILLVEHPRMLMQLYNMLEDTVTLRLLKGIALGSHDLASFCSFEHTSKNLGYAREQVYFIGKALGINAIDIASMDVSSADNFKTEVMEGFRAGYDGKFIIHPRQLSIFHIATQYSSEEIAWATRVQEAYRQTIGKDEFKPVIIQNEILERPHLERAFRILSSSKKYGK